MRPIRIAHIEEHERDFVRWTGNMLRGFIERGEVVLVKQADNPDLMFAGVWRPHAFGPTPTVLVSNENWALAPPLAPLSAYRAVIGIAPPPEPCRFVPFSYAAAHFDASPSALYQLREELLAKPKSKFCCMVVSSARGPLGRARLEIAAAVDKWKRINSAGKVGNNTGPNAPRRDFLRWIAQYKYMICLENSAAPGYVTEKPWQAWFAGTVPVYAGGAANTLNAASFVNAAFENVVERLQALEADPAAYEAMRRAPLSAERLSQSAFKIAV